jgi:capsid protein
MAAKRSTSNTTPAKATALDYDATTTTGRRRQPSTRIAAEHVILPEGKRTKLLATAQDQVRNASIAAWMVRRHMDYVSKFKFQFRTGKEQLDLLINRLFDWHARPKNFDIAERFGREEMFKMFECEKTLAGDGAMIKLAIKKLQAIESDMMAFPKIGKYNYGTKKYDSIPSMITKMVQKDTGVVMDQSAQGRIKQFCICNRGHDGSHVSYDHLEASENLIFDGYFTRFSSQVRGVSPLSTAINTIQDIYEGVDFNLAKAKVHALFGIALMRDYAGPGTDQEEVLDLGGASGVTAGADENLAATTANTYGTKQISTSLQQIKPSEMMLLDMDTKEIGRAHV